MEINFNSRLYHYIFGINYIKAAKNQKSNFRQKVGFSRFSILAFSATNSRTNSNPIFGVCILFRKVRKAPDFFRNPVLFMVAEAGLEPTTSGL